MLIWSEMKGECLSVPSSLLLPRAPQSEFLMANGQLVYADCSAAILAMQKPEGSCPQGASAWGSQWVIKPCKQMHLHLLFGADAFTYMAKVE